jgi:hypothetical protein
MRCLDCKFYLTAIDACEEGGDTECPDQDIPCDEAEDKE